MSTCEQRLPHYEEELKELFAFLAANRSQRVSLKEIKLHLAAQGIFLTKEEEKRLMQDAPMDWHSFRTWALNKEEQVYHVFQALDRNGTGFLTLEELLLAKEGERVMRLGDKDGDGKLSYKEFFELLRHHHWHMPEGPFAALALLRQSALLWNADTGILVDFKQEGGKLRNLAAGFTAACVSRTIVAPLDRIQCLLQVPTYLQKGLVCPTTGAVHYNTSVKEALKVALEQNGVRGLWRGNMVNLTRLVPEIALRSYLYEHFKAGLVWASPSLPTVTHLTVHHRVLAATSAAVVAYGIGYPITVIKTQLQATSERRSLSEIVRNTFNREHGIGNFYRGMCPSLMRIAADAALFEWGKSLFMLRLYPHIAKEPGAIPSIWSLVFVGAGATTISQMASYPLLLVRTRMQVSNLELTKNVIPHSRLFKQSPGLWATFSHIVRQEGFRGLYRGALINAIKVVPVSTMTLIGYEQGKRVFGVKTMF